jgi:hypothetical protein
MAGVERKVTAHAPLKHFIKMIQLVRISDEMNVNKKEILSLFELPAEH